MNSFVGEGSRSGDDANGPMLMDVTGHDANFALVHTTRNQLLTAERWNKRTVLDYR